MRRLCNVMDTVRLNKFLVDAGVCSRREADRLIEAGKVKVNGAPAVLGQKVLPTDHVRVLGRTAHIKRERVYLAYHKPVGVICTSDPTARDNIIEAVGYPDRVFHIGRLDVASSGLILLTNDGGIVNKILRAEGKHEKEYIVRVERPITAAFVERMQKGVMLDGQKTLPAKVARMGADIFSLTLVEGRNRQIRRMCEALGFKTVSLKRIRVMHITLDNLPPGKWRMLTDEERQKLLARVV